MRNSSFQIGGEKWLLVTLSRFWIGEQVMLPHAFFVDDMLAPRTNNQFCVEAMVMASVTAVSPYLVLNYTPPRAI
jgi:hypothetical protein